MPYLIHHFLENSADVVPAKEAVVHGDHRCTYLEIEEKANCLANWLLEFGLNKGERVAVLLRNSVAYVCCYYGVLKAGGVVVPLNTGLEAREIKEILADCSAAILIFENHFAELVKEIQKTASKPMKFVATTYDNNTFSGNENADCADLCGIYSSYSAKRPQVQLIDKDLSSIIYTSGSTGKPKGVMLTHLNIVANTRSIVSYLGLATNDRCMVVLPFYYVYGKSLLNTHFAVSATVIIDNRFAFPNAVLKNMIGEKVTGFAGVPSTYSILLNKSSVAKMNFADLRYLTQAGGHMPASIKKRLVEIFPDKNIYIMYGATEASARLSYLDPKALPNKINSIGKAIANVELRVLGQNGGEATTGEGGEIVAKGSNLMLGYWHDQHETKKVLKNGWYYTGDLGFKDKDGFFYVTGRKRDMIKVGIHKVSATEIEEVLYKYPGILEAAVIGVPDDVLGEVAKAIVVADTKAKLYEREIIRSCAESLPNYKLPKAVIFVHDLPKNGAGKVLKDRLKELLSKNYSQ